MDVNDSDLAKLIAERDHLRKQVTGLQERCTELVMENRELRKPWVVIESDFKTNQVLAVRLWSNDAKAKADMDKAEMAGDTRLCQRAKLDDGVSVLLPWFEHKDLQKQTVSACCGALIVQAEGSMIPDYPVCSQCGKPAGV